MSVTELTFDKENELEDWIFENFKIFIENGLIINGFKINTTSGKGGIPDGFAINFIDKEWYIIECELLKHGVWPHIAEQITRFVVSVQNPDTIRSIRDKFFEYLISSESLLNSVCSDLNTEEKLLLKELETFLESIQPKLIIFIDEINQDLNDMVHALNISTEIFVVKKLLVDGKKQLYSPDVNVPVISSEPVIELQESSYDIIQILGGGKLEKNISGFKYYRLNDNTIIHIKKSKFYPSNQLYWYGISPNSLDKIKQFKVDEVIFVMGDSGLVKVPIDFLTRYLSETYTTNNPDGSIRHYHCKITEGPEPELIITHDKKKFSLIDYFIPFD